MQLYVSIHARMCDSQPSVCSTERTPRKIVPHGSMDFAQAGQSMTRIDATRQRIAGDVTPAAISLTWPRGVANDGHRNQRLSRWLAASGRLGPYGYKDTRIREHEIQRLNDGIDGSLAHEQLSGSWITPVKLSASFLRDLTCTPTRYTRSWSVIFGASCSMCSSPTSSHSSSETDERIASLSSASWVFHCVFSFLTWQAVNRLAYVNHSSSNYNDQVFCVVCRTDARKRDQRGKR